MKNPICEQCHTTFLKTIYYRKYFENPHLEVIEGVLYCPSCKKFKNKGGKK